MKTCLTVNVSTRIRLKEWTNKVGFSSYDALINYMLDKLKVEEIVDDLLETGDI